MRPVTLILGTRFSLTNEVVEQIQRDHASLRVVDASADWTAVAGFRTLPPATGRAWEEASQRLNEHMAEAEIVYCLQYIPRDLRKRAPKLKWVHFGGTGIDRTHGSDILGSDLLLTNSRGALAVPIAEWVVMLMLMLAKRIRQLGDQQQQKRWERFTAGDLDGKTVGVLGLGHIGEATARRCKAFGMRVLATRRSCTRRASRDDGMADEVFPPGQVLEMLPQCDFVVLALPLTAETRHILGERELRALKPATFVINVGRGGLIDEPALIRALREGRIAGAGLDVFETEPLPPGSPLWEMPNVIVTPHMAGGTESHDERVSAILRENLGRYMQGRPLLNLIHPERGY